MKLIILIKLNFILIKIYDSNVDQCSYHFEQFDESGNLVHFGGEPILLNGTVPRDPEVLKLLDKFRPAVQELTETKIGFAKVHLDGLSCRMAECNLGNMITDAHIYSRVKQYNGTYWTDASIAFLQGGGIRSAFQAGQMTKFDLKSILPFNNSLFVVNISGKVLFDVLEHSVDQYTGDRGEFMQMSGIRVTYDMQKTPGSRIILAEALCAECEIPLYSAIDSNKQYGVIISDFLYNGGDGYSMFAVISTHFQYVNFIINIGIRCTYFSFILFFLSKGFGDEINGHN